MTIQILHIFSWGLITIIYLKNDLKHALAAVFILTIFCISAMQVNPAKHADIIGLILSYPFVIGVTNFLKKKS